MASSAGGCNQCCPNNPHEDKVEKVLQKKANHVEETKEVKDDCLKSNTNNTFPRRVRTLFRNKKNVSNAMKTVKSVRRCLQLRRKLESTEEELKDFYLIRKSKLEDAAILKIKHNPRAFYAYAKRQSKTFSGVGPFLKTNEEPYEESEAEALKVKYEKVFRKPKEEMLVKNTKEYFKDIDNENNI